MVIIATTPTVQAVIVITRSAVNIWMITVIAITEEPTNPRIAEMRSEAEIQAELFRLRKMREIETVPGFPDKEKNMLIVNEAINSLEWVLGLR